VQAELERREVLNPSQIADMLYADRPTATLIIGNLQKSGWVAKEQDPENRRRFRVVITPRGRRKLDSYLERLQRHLEESG
jgi:DNA-binding MarR family transcriptional regulator